jgi:hypothetical protein
MKFEPKLEFKESKDLKELIEKNYFELGDRGKITRKNKLSPLRITKEDPNYIMFKGWNNNIVRLTNDEIMTSSLKFIVEEEQDLVNLFPINTYCIIEDEKYSFY